MSSKHRKQSWIRHECFECGREVMCPKFLTYCPYCGNKDNFYVMN